MTTPTAKSEIANELRRLREAATNGEWFGDPEPYCEYIFANRRDPEIVFNVRGSIDTSIANREFVTFAANHAIELCDQHINQHREVEAQKQEIVDLQQRLAQAEQRIEQQSHALGLASDHRKQLESDLEAARGEVAGLRELINTPVVDNFLEAVRLEAAHQCERWGVDTDAGKTPADWFWLIGYLAGKALTAAITGDKAKAQHHTISTAAACLNWHAHMIGQRTKMRPGIAEPPELREQLSAKEGE